MSVAGDGMGVAGDDRDVGPSAGVGASTGVGLAAGGGPAAGVAIGVAAAMLGVAPETLRSWGRRYGVVPSGSSSGGHRRYSETDLSRLRYMQQRVDAGMTPAAAAQLTLQTPVDQLAGRDPVSERRGKGRGGPGGRVLAVPGASAELRGLARAATRLDADAMNAILTDLLVERGVVSTWNQILRPVLVAAGARWARTGEGIDLEHVLSHVTVDALRAHRQRQQRPIRTRPVLLAAPAREQHCLPLHVLAAALAERRRPTLMLGDHAPASAIIAAARRSGASALFLWRQIPADVPAQPDAAGPLGAPDSGRVDVVTMPPTRPPVVVIIGGPGWTPQSQPAAALVASSLEAAVSMLSAEIAP